MTTTRTPVGLRPTTPRRGGSWVLALVGLLVGLVALTGCSGSGDESADSGSAAGGQAAVAEPKGASGFRAAADTADSGAAGTPTSGSEQAAAEQPSVISTGDVVLRSRDVGGVVGDVRRVVAGYGGSVQQESTDTDDHGDPEASHLTVRVPSDSFATAMADLGRTATLVSTSSRTRDVTTTVLDNRVRVQVERRSIDRISTLLDQAASIRDVISIESELAQRQADLGSLESQERYLADQTSMATITVSVRRTTPGAVTRPDHHTGFAAGLGAGWRALRHTAAALATVTGALLPWLVVGGLVGVPTSLLIRRRRRVQAGTASGTASGSTA